MVESLLVILPAKGFKGGGINFDAKTRRNSTDLEDIFYAHIGGMDAFARALIVANNVLENSDYLKLREDRYASFGSKKGRAFENGELSLEDLQNIALENGDGPVQKSGRQELFENIINQYI